MEPPVHNLRMMSAANAQAKGDLLMAQQQYAEVLADHRGDAEAMQQYGTLLAQTDRLDVAIVAAKRAVDLRPDNHESWHNYGFFLALAGRYDEGEKAIRKSLSIKPHERGYQALGMVLYALGRFDESLIAYDRALDRTPGDVDLIDKRTNALLAMRRFRQGFLDNKLRWKYAAAHPFMHSGVDEWMGEDLSGKHIIVLHEQGFGDTLQFCRYLPQLKSKFNAARVTFSCRDTMIGLIRASWLCDDVVGIQEAFGVGADVKSPMLTVPAFMAIDPDNYASTPYIAPQPRPPVLPANGRRKVGLVWGGIPMYADDQWRSLDPRNYLPVFEQHGEIDFYSLQADDRAKELWQMGLNAFATDLSGKIKDWSDTAAIVSELDLVISVDTAVAHLAGAMGKPVWLTIPRCSCWRWMEHDRDTTPWYPTARLFRQTVQGDWRSVMADVSNALAD